MFLHPLHYHSFLPLLLNIILKRDIGILMQNPMQWDRCQQQLPPKLNSVWGPTKIQIDRMKLVISVQERRGKRKEKKNGGSCSLVGSDIQINWWFVIKKILTNWSLLNISPGLLEGSRYKHRITPSRMHEIVKEKQGTELAIPVWSISNKCNSYSKQTITLINHKA